MTNSDYLLKAAIKKVTEKLSEILVEKIEEASRMEKTDNIQENEAANTYKDSKIKKALNEIEDINKQIDLFYKSKIISYVKCSVLIYY